MFKMFYLLIIQLVGILEEGVIVEVVNWVCIFGQILMQYLKLVIVY